MVSVMAVSGSPVLSGLQSPIGSEIWRSQDVQRDRSNMLELVLVEKHQETTL